VATAKPTREDRRRVPHHLVDCSDPRTDFSLGDFVRAAERLLAEIATRSRLPIVAGGTGMYLRGLLRGVLATPERDPQLRERLRAIARRRGPVSLHRWLERLDREAAARLAPEDTQRVVRAMELALSGRGTWTDRLHAEGTWQSRHERFRALKIGLDMDRERLNSRLEARVDRFFEQGLVGEVRRLLAEGVHREANAFKAIGYREVLRAVEAGEEPESVRGEVKKNTRRYAKRQRTWFRREPNVVWLDAALGADALTRRVLEIWSAFSPRAEG
jgi:tRNA dimethylallyltransferase